MILGDDSNRQHPLARAGEVFLFWIPVVIPLVLLSQLGTQGMRPALEEAEAMAEDERKLDEELLVTEERRSELDSEYQSLGDEIYRHRSARRLRSSLRTSAELDRRPAPARKR